MKKLFFLFLTGALLLASSCKNDDEDVNVVSVDEAAEVVAAALGGNSGGGAAFVETSSSVSAQQTALRAAANPEIELKHSLDTVKGSYDFMVGATKNTVTWEYNWDATHKLYTTVNSVPDYILSTFTYDGTVNGVRFSSTFNGAGNLKFTSLGSGTVTLTPGTYVVDELWTMNGTFTREASHTSKKWSKQINSTTTITYKDCEVYTDGSRKIKSGLGIINIKGSVPNKGDFEYNGTITFNENSVGVLEIDGKSYTISIVTGEVIE